MQVAAAAQLHCQHASHQVNLVLENVGMHILALPPPSTPSASRIAEARTTSPHRAPKTNVRAQRTGVSSALPYGGARQGA